MPTQVKKFSGFLNTDDAVEEVNFLHHIDAKNIVFRGEEGAASLRCQNIYGNSLIPNSLKPSGNNVVLFTHNDTVKRRIFYFVYNSNNNHAIFIYNIVGRTIDRLIQSGINTNGDILNFDITKPISSVNILYNDGALGDILFYVDSLGRPTKINIQRYLAGTYTNIQRSFIDVAKAPAQMPPKVVYENDDSITVNNLRNKLFQFRTRFVYDDYEKSVYSGASITPLPNQDSLSTTQSDPTKNNRIALFISTGDVDVIKIEIAVRVTENGVTTDWQLLDSLDKSILNIASNTVYKYLFYNNSTLTPLDAIEAAQLQDLVPQIADTQELLDGSTPIYGGITEGYDAVNNTMSIINTINTAPNLNYVFSDVNGLLCFAQMNGLDSGVDGTQITFYLTGTGTNNSSQEVILLDSPYLAPYNPPFVANMVSGTTNLSINVQLGAVVSTSLGAIQTALIANGFTITSTTNNSVTATYPSTFTLLSSGIQINYSTIDGSIVYNSYVNRSNQYFGIQYFDEKGRTNGVTTNVNLKIKTPLSSYTGFFSTLPIWNQLQINHRPPTWAKYYSIVRSENLTYSKLLYWISSSSTGDTSVYTSNQYAYINIDNINDYNVSIQSSQGVVGYEFTKGDRITIYGRYDSAGTEYNYAPTLYDYEILGEEASPIINGISITGRFLKIKYPSNDIGANLNFSGASDSTGKNYQNYKIIIYGLKDSLFPTQTPFYEIGKVFGIGNAGTTNAYHIGLEQTQTSNLSQPAIISIINGDYFFRKREVLLPIPYNRSFPTIDYGNNYVTARVGVDNSDVIDTTNYRLNYQANLQANLTSFNYPQSTDPALFENKSSTLNYKIRLQGSIPVFADHPTNVGIYIKIVDSSNVVTSLLNVVTDQPILDTTKGYTINLDSTFVVPANNKAFFIFSNSAGIVNVHIGSFVLKLSIINQKTIPVYDTSFSDIQNIRTNSNGRPTVIQINAKRNYFNTLVRWGQPYELGTTINNTNRFYEENFDEFSKEYGGIKRLKLHGRNLRVFQFRKCGVVGVYAKYIKDNNNNNTLITSDKIIEKNNIQYYEGDFGIGDNIVSLATSGYVDYFVDSIKGYVCRLSQDGITPVSELYKGQYYLRSLMLPYANQITRTDGSYGKIIGYYDTYEEQYMMCLQGGTLNGQTLADYTFAFNERRNCFSSFFDFHPEQATNMESVTYTFLNGDIYIHDDTAPYCNFYGTQYDAYITIPFNQNLIEKKTWKSVTELANQIWECPLIYSNVKNGIGVRQETNLIPSDFKLFEGNYSAAILRDVNSPNGIINGDEIKGNWLVMKLMVQNANSLVFLSEILVKYIDSPLTTR
jgi:hypothetical protein